MGISAKKYFVTYHANGARGGSVPSDTEKYGEGSLVTIMGNSGGLYRDGYTFGGWTLNSSGTGTIYKAGDKIIVGTSDITLYAKWIIEEITPDEKGYFITYNANGAGGGSVPSDTKKYGVGASVTVLGNSGVFFRNGYTFVGWTLNSSGTGTVYKAGDKITVGTSDITLYAKWIVEESNNGDDSGSDGGTTPIPAPTPTTTPTPTPVEKPAEETKKAVEDVIEKGGEILIKLEANELLNISTETIQEILKSDKPLLIEKQGVKVEISTTNLEALAAQAGSGKMEVKSVNRSHKGTSRA